MTNGWTLERRKRQAELIQTWKPWCRSTGPRTEEGKAATAKNSTRHGMRGRAFLDEMRQIRDIVREYRDTASEA